MSAVSTDYRLALSRVCSVLNAKGGVGKTSITVNVAGRLAGSGLRVLVVDLDVSGGSALNFGVKEHPDNDHGKGLFEAVYNDADLTAIVNVRDNLDVIPGGKQLDLIAQIASNSSLAADLPGGSVEEAFARKLAPVADRYDLVLIDGPPGNRDLQRMALVAAKWIIVPVKEDRGSWDALDTLGPEVRRIRETNPTLEYLGMVIFAHPIQAARILREAKDDLAPYVSAIPLFDTVIRHSASAAYAERDAGQLSYEVAANTTTARKERIAALRAKKDLASLPVRTLSGNAADLDGDYERLAQEICNRIAKHENADQPADAKVGE